MILVNNTLLLSLHMSEQQQQIGNGIQSSAYVSSQSLLSASIPLNNNDQSENNSNIISKKSSKSRLTEGDDEGEGHYGGTMERFFQSEVRPVYFGGKNDAFLLLKVTLSASLLVNLFGVLVYMQYDNLIPQNPSEHHPHGILRLLTAFESALSAYYSDGQIVVGWMLSCWFLGYNMISAVIWWQFERREQRVADDYEIIPSFRLRRRGLGGNNSSATNLHQQTVEISDQNAEAAYKKSTKNDQSDAQNPYDKSVIVISMPNGDFSVGKRQKVFFNQ